MGAVGLGYHQCKWSYYRESTLEVTGTDASLEIARTCEDRWSPGYAAISILLRGLPDGTEAPRFEVDGQPITATTDALGRPVLRVSPEFKQVTIVL